LPDDYILGLRKGTGWAALPEGVFYDVAMQIANGFGFNLNDYYFSVTALNENTVDVCLSAKCDI